MRCCVWHVLCLQPQIAVIWVMAHTKHLLQLEKSDAFDVPQQEQAPDIQPSHVQCSNYYARVIWTATHGY